MKNFFKTILYIGLLVLTAFLLFKYIAPLVAPFLVAVFLAFLIEPLVGIVQNFVRLPRPVAVGFTMLMVFGGLALAITLAVTRLIVELAHLSTFLPKYIFNIQSVLLLWQKKAGSYYANLPADVVQFINRELSTYNLNSVVERAQVITGKAFNVILQLVSAVPVWVVLIVVSGIATYFMSKDKKVIIMFWIKVLPAPWGKKSLEIAKDIFQAVINYVRAQLLLITITFLQTMIGLYIIDAPYVLLMALIIGIADLLPVLGPSTIYIPWIAWEIITGNSSFAVKLLLLFAIVIVVRQILETKIVSSTMGLHPLATLMSMYVGLKLVGGLGVIAGPLFLITVKAFASAGLLGWKNENENCP